MLYNLTRHQCFLLLCTVTQVRPDRIHQEKIRDDLNEGLSLLQTKAQLLQRAKSNLTSTLQEVAYINIIRHGEKCSDDLDHGAGLTAVGFERAAYLGRCMSSKAPSAAMPFGAATAVMAGAGPPPSVRPKDTVTPLADALNLTLHMPCSSPTDQDCVADHAVRYLTNEGTLVVAWTYQMLPYLTAALNIPDLPRHLDSWPEACPSKTFAEPQCTYKVITPPLEPPSQWHLPYEATSVCFDAIWQVKLTRASSREEWQPRSVRQLAEGFGGMADGPCAQDLAPGS